MTFSIPLRITVDEGASAPSYGTEHAAGADLKAFLKQPLTLAPGQRMKIPTGLRFEIPEGYEVQIRPRSGLADKYGITVLNTPGTIDADYRGEIQVILINLGEASFQVDPGMRIAQMVLAPFTKAQFEIEDSGRLRPTSRGEKGFGHTGLL